MLSSTRYITYGKEPVVLNRLSHVGRAANPSIVNIEIIELFKRGFAKPVSIYINLPEKI